MITINSGTYGRVTTVRIYMEFAFKKVSKSYRPMLIDDVVKAFHTLRDMTSYIYRNIMQEPDSDRGLNLKWNAKSIERIEQVEETFKAVVTALADDVHFAASPEYKEVIVTLREFKKYLKSKIAQAAAKAN